jgi:hypothetical protein
MERFHSDLPLGSQLLAVFQVHSMHHHVLQLPKRQTALQILKVFGFFAVGRGEVDRALQLVLDALGFLGLEGHSLGSVELQLLLVVLQLAGVVRSSGALLAKPVLRL